MELLRSKVPLCLICLALLSLIFMPACSAGASTQPAPQTPREINAFVGSSARGAMDPAGELFFKKTGIKVFFNYGGSGSLLSQMQLSRTGDLFIPASPDYILKAAAGKSIYPETETKIYYLVPAIIVQKGNPQNIKSLADLARPGLRVTIADPKTVPAGLYAYEILDYNRMLAEVGNNMVAYGTSNEQISSYVSLKTVDAAIGWDVVALQQPQNLEAIYLQPDQVPRLSYMSGAISVFTTDKAGSQAFLDFLITPEARAIFKMNSYYTTPEEAAKLAPRAKIGGEYRLPADYQPLVK